MKKYLAFGEKIKEYREKQEETITKVAESIGVDRTYMSKLENGHERPSKRVLNALISHLSLSKEEATGLSWLAGYEGKTVAAEKQERKEVIDVAEKNIPTGDKKRNIQVNIPNTSPVLYSDSVFITSSQWGIVFDFAQNVGPTEQQNVVARVGMSKEHAKALLDVLQKKLQEKNKAKN